LQESLDYIIGRNQKVDYLLCYNPVENINNHIMEIAMQELIDALIFVASLWIMLCCLYLAEIIIMTFIPPPDNSLSLETKEKGKKLRDE